MNSRTAILIVISALVSGCLNFNFEAPSHVSKERVLAITVDPPEAPLLLEGGIVPRVGEDFVLEALVVDAGGSPFDPSRPDVRFEWSVCASAARLIGSVGLPQPDSDPEECAAGGPGRIELEQGGDLPPHAARLRREQLDLAFQRLLTSILAGGGPGGGGDLPIDPAQAQTLLAVLASVGLPLTVDLRVVAGPQEELELLAFKRIAIAMRPDLTSNPPAPRFAIDGAWLSARGNLDPHRCLPESGERPVVRAGAAAAIAPDPDEEPWLETYPVYDFGGSVQSKRESAYYAWYSTAGAFDADITQRPERDVEWTAPVIPGVYPIWLVVRDGHLGASYCRAEIEVRPSP